MKTLFNNKYFQLLPEISILVLVLFYWFSSTLLNPLAFALTIAIVFLIRSKNRITGLIIGSIILLLGLYLILALLSDIRKITDFNAKDMSFIIYASLFIIVNISTSVWLLSKYSKVTQNSKLALQKFDN